MRKTKSSTKIGVFQIPNNNTNVTVQDIEKITASAMAEGMGALYLVFMENGDNKLFVVNIDSNEEEDKVADVNKSFYIGTYYITPDAF